MKLILLMIVLVCLSVSAQTNTVRVFTTNYVAAAPTLREVDGQLYDVLRSQKWESVKCKYQNQAGELALFRKINRVKIGEHPRAKPDELGGMGGAGIGNIYSAPPMDRGIYEETDGDSILLKNFPVAHIVTGQELTPRLLRVSETNFNGSIVAIYDCGTPHMVPVITSKLVKTQ